MAKAQLELKLANAIKRLFFKKNNINNKRRTRENTGPLDGNSCLTNKDIDKAKMLNAFLASIFNTELEDCLW